MEKKISILIKVIPLIVFLLLWELLTRNNPTALFFYASPSKIANAFWSKTLDGSLWYDTSITLMETIIGFLLGNIFGVAIGLSLWFSKAIFNISV